MVHRVVRVGAVVLWYACSNSARVSDAATLPRAGSDASAISRADAAPASSSDAFVSTGRDAGPDAGRHLCDVEGCNGAVDALSSARGCPRVPPTEGLRCDLASGAECFYCAPDEVRLPLALKVPVTVCESGVWRQQRLDISCD